MRSLLYQEPFPLVKVDDEPSGGESQMMGHDHSHGNCDHQHDHGHDHQKGHRHSHGHHGHHHHHAGPDGTMGRMGLAFALNLGFAVLELFGGFFTNSVAIISDALHDFGDASAIGLAMVLERLSRRSADGQFSYGYRRASTFSALIMGVVLIVGSLFILMEAVPRLVKPEQPNTQGMLIFAVIGLAVNGFAAWRMSRGQSLSERMILWHLLEDVLGWALVLVGALLMSFFDLPQIDAALACLMALWILYNVLRNLKHSVNVFLQGVPSHVSMTSLRQKIAGMANVIEVHHCHLWSLDGENHIFTAHIVVAESLGPQQIEELKRQIKARLKQEDQILEATLEIEFHGGECADPSHA